MLVEDYSLVNDLLRRLDSAQHVISRRDACYRGAQPLRFMADRVDPSVMAFNTNLTKVAVQSVAERIRIETLDVFVGGVDYSDAAKKLIRDSDFPMVLQSLITEMLAVGSAYMIVWVDEFGRPTVTAESAEQVAVSRDPVSRAVKAAVKRWVATDANGVVTAEHVVLYQAEQITRFVKDASEGRLRVVEDYPNPLGVVPVVPLVNVERIHDEVGMSVVDDLQPLLDALNKVIVDMLTTSEAVARPKRYATGVILEETPQVGFMADSVGEEPDEPLLDDVQAPFKDADDMWVSESTDARFGQLAGADLSGYKTAVELLMQQIMAVTSLPPHLVGVTTSNPATAEALRASEVALASNAAGRVRVVNRPVEWAIRLLVAIDAGVDPGSVQVALGWADTTTRSVAAEADAAVKLRSAEIATTDEARAIAGQNGEL